MSEVPEREYTGPRRVDWRPPEEGTGVVLPSGQVIGGTGGDSLGDLIGQIAKHFGGPFGLGGGDLGTHTPGSGLPGPSDIGKVIDHISKHYFGGNIPISSNPGGITLLEALDRDPGLHALSRDLLRRLEAHARRAPTESVHALDRDGANLRGWVHRLAGLASPVHAHYRVAAVPPDTSWRVLESPEASAPRRVAAVVALRALLDAEGKARVAGIIETSASDALRKGLRVAIDGDEDAIAAQLEELEG